MRVLNIASVLPSPLNEAENDIILKSALKHEQLFGSDHLFVLVIPYSNSVLSYFSSRLSRANSLIKQGSYTLFGKDVIVVPNFTLRSNMVRESLYPVSYMYSRRVLQAIVEKFRPDVIHGHSALASGYFTRRLSLDVSIPYVLSVRGIQQFFFQKKVIDNVFNADALISINFEHFKRVNEITSNSNHILLPHGVSSRFFVTPEINRSPFPVKIVSICHLIKRKNLDLVIKALAAIDHDFEYHIYGDGEELGSLKRLVQYVGLENKVFFNGSISHEDVPSVLSKFDIFVLPSYPETLGRVFFEAMAAHLPIIGARAGGISGFINEFENGLLVDHENLVELEKVLRRLISDSDLRRKIGDQAFEFAKQYSEDAVITKLDGIYNKLL